MTQFVAIRFRPGEKRSYTYANDGEPCAAGDFVQVPLRNGTPTTVEVMSVTDEAPPFECKPMLRQAERPDSWPISDTLPLEGN
jgi:hypothetical protein